MIERFFSNDSDANASAQKIDAVRAHARVAFDKYGFPTRHNEAWKYTQLKGLTAESLLSPSAPDSGFVSTILPASLSEKNSRIVCVDGYFSPNHSTLPEGVEVIAYDALIDDAKTAQVLSAFMECSDVISAQESSAGNEKTYQNEGHIALNMAAAQEAILIRLKKNVRLEKPLEIIYLTTQASRDASTYTQLWIQCEEGSHAVVIERFETEGLAPSGQAQKETDAILPHMHNHMLQGILAKGAALEHYRLATLPDEFSHLYTAKVTLNERSDYRVFSDYKGGALARQEVDVVIAGQHARCDQQGLICAKGNEHHDMYLPVRHAAENSYSNQHIRQLLDDQSTGIFYGRVDVPRGSHNTEAHQLNRNMLVGEKSQAISRPELEILTDEVVCSHGSTTGSLNDEALYYLCARGLDMVQAKRLLVDAFIDEMLETVSLESVRNYRAAD